MKFELSRCLKLTTIIGIPIVAFGLFVNGQYADIPLTESQNGRTKNSVSAMVAGIVGREIYGNSKVNLNVEKRWFPDTKVSGETSHDSIDTCVNTITSSAKFSVKKNDNGYLKGDVKKSEWNWNVLQTDSNSYHITRAGTKFDTSLDITVKDGIIRGTYVRTGMDWKINGEYDASGNVDIRIDVPMGLDIELKGKIVDR